ncbi:MAG: peptidylprolyl isomerase [Clostridiales bacterium]|nr:peptidylprolyl isomerase [Clostridiales bacterium]
MKKEIALIAMLALAVSMLSGCNLIGYDEELDGAQAVAKVNDTEITKAEWLAYRDYLASYYQQYMQQYYGYSMEITEDDLKVYGETALENMIKSQVLADKMAELGFDPLGEEDAASVEAYADSMWSFYKQLVRYQNYPDVETVEEEAARLAEEAAAAATPDEATPDEATPAEAAPVETAPAEPVATITDAELDEMLTRDLEAMGYTREYFVQSQTATVQQELIEEYAAKDVTVSDDEVKAEFDARVAEQKEKMTETPTLYAQYMSNGTDCYYVPAGYRGVKNLLVKLPSEMSGEISTLKSTLSTAQTTVTNVQTQLDELKAEDTASYDEETLAAYNEQVAALEEQLAQAQQTVDETQPKIDEMTEAAYAAIEATAQEILARAQAGEDFDALLEAYGEDTGMTSEPNKSRGYLVCEGLSLYEQSFQDAAMALEKVGDVSAELVKTSYGYHILQYATDVAEGEIEFTDEIKADIHDELLADAKDAAYEAAVTQWTAEASVTTYPKVMK